MVFHVEYTAGTFEFTTRETFCLVVTRKKRETGEREETKENERKPWRIIK